MRLFLAPIAAAALIGATMPETRLTVTLPPGFVGDAGGRLLLFVAPATPANADAVDTDASNSEGVSIAARDVAGFGPARSVTLDTQQTAYPTGFAALAPGDYRVQAVLDRNGDYAYGGRGPGDLVSKVVTVRFPLASGSSIALDHAVPPDTDQFDTTGFPPAAIAQIAASRAHLHEEHIASRVLTRFRGTRQAVAAWVLTPPG